MQHFSQFLSYLSLDFRSFAISLHFTSDFSLFHFLRHKKARNKPADGSSLSRTREKTPIGQKGGPNKPPLTSKSSSQSLNTKVQSSVSSRPLSKQKQKKKKQIYDVNVTIDLVSNSFHFIRSLLAGRCERFRLQSPESVKVLTMKSISYGENKCSWFHVGTSPSYYHIPNDFTSNRVKRNCFSADFFYSFVSILINFRFRFCNFRNTFFRVFHFARNRKNELDKVSRWSETFLIVDDVAERE